MARQSVTTRFENVYFGRFLGHDVILTDIMRLTDKQLERMTRKLWSAAGQDPDRLEQVSAAELQRFARTHAGRYPEVEVTVYDDDTYSYRTRSSGGGDFPLTNIVAWDKDDDILPMPSPLDGRPEAPMFEVIAVGYVDVSD